jgi:signal-transduction protein with cAMP-binding, CBS, and nucleotidyltransferase domain
MRAGDICNRSIVTCPPTATAATLAELMRDEHTTEVIVVEEHSSRRVAKGIVTFRDMVVRVIAGHVDAATTLASDIMSSSVETARDTELTYDAISRMREKRIARLVVVDAEGALVGVLTANGVTEFLAGELLEVARISPEQIRSARTDQGGSRHGPARGATR